MWGRSRSSNLGFGINKRDKLIKKEVRRLVVMNGVILQLVRFGNDKLNKTQ